MPEGLEGLEAILGNPELMGKLMAMAQSLQSPAPPQPVPPPRPPAPQPPAPPPPPKPEGPDPAVLAKLAGVISKTSIDGDQRRLLAALRPYLSAGKLSRLQKAMQASRLASAASGFWEQAHLQGR